MGRNGTHNLLRDKAGIICEKDREMLYDFSRRSLNGLKNQSLLSLTLLFFSAYRDGNIRKEVEKDRLIIEEAADAYGKGLPVCDLDLEELFEKTKRIDKQFLDGLSVPSFTVAVRYSDIADIRIQRIWRISRTVYSLLPNWPEQGGFCDAVRSTYTAGEFRAMIIEILHLYNLETRTLGEAIRSPFHKSVAAYTESLFEAMELAMEELADAYSMRVFGDKLRYA